MVSTGELGSDGYLTNSITIAKDGLKVYFDLAGYNYHFTGPAFTDSYVHNLAKDSVFVFKKSWDSKFYIYSSAKGGQNFAHTTDESGTVIGGKNLVGGIYDSRLGDEAYIG